MDTIEDLLARGLRRLHAAHHQGARQAAANDDLATSSALKRALRSGAAEHEAQAERLEKVFEKLRLAVGSEADAVMEGIVADNEAANRALSPSPELDQELIRSCQLAAHYYLANYGTMRAYAQGMGHRRAARLLGRTIDETARADERLTRLAVRLQRRERRHPLRTGATILATAGLAAGGYALLRGREREQEPANLGERPIETPPAPVPVAVTVSPPHATPPTVPLGKTIPLPPVDQPV